MLERIIKTIKLLTVEPYIFFCVFGYTVRIVSFQNLLIERACRNMHGYAEIVCSDLETHKDEQTASIETGNNLYMGIMLMSSLPAIVVAIFLGPWSDKYSRKYPLIIAVSGMLLEGVAGAVLTVFEGISPTWFIACALFSGVSGGFIISISAACSYLSDVTDEKSRPTRFAVAEFFSISSIIVSSPVGGQVFERFGYVAAMSLSPASFLIAILYIVFCVAETKPPVPEDKRREMFRDLLRIDNMKQSYLTCTKKRAGNIRCQIWCLVYIGAVMRFVDMGTLVVGFPFTKNMYQWSVAEFSNAVTVFYITNAIVTVIIVPALSTRFRVHEAAIGLVGIFSVTAKMVFGSVAFTSFYFYVALISGTLANAAGIAVRSRLSKLVSKGEIGRAFSLLGTCESVTPLLGTVVFLQLYNASLTFFPGLVFAVAAVLMIPSAIMFTWMMKMPTISLTEYARFEEMKTATPLGPVSTNYQKLEEDAELPVY